VAVIYSACRHRDASFDYLHFLVEVPAAFRRNASHFRISSCRVDQSHLQHARMGLLSLEFRLARDINPLWAPLDATLVLTESFLFMGIVGGLLWAVLFYLCNWPLITRFLLPVNVNGVLMSLADLQGFHYVRTGTPEYLRIINHGTLRTFGQDPIYLSIAFAGFISMIVYKLFLGVGWAFTKTQFS